MRIPLTLFLVLGLVGCGSSGGDSAPPPAQQPGTLRTIALEGEAAPSGAGTFLSFPVATPMSAAEGSWCAFVANTSAAGQVAYVVEPDGGVVPVFAEGDSAPGLLTGDIDETYQVWVNEDGWLVAYVSVEGNAGGVTEGLVSAQIDGGVVSNVTSLVYDELDDFEAFDSDFSFLRGERFLFRAATPTGTGFWAIGVNGNGLEKLVASGDPVPNGKTVVDVYAVSVSGDGTQFAFVAETTGALDRDGVYTGDVGSALFGEIAVTGDPLLTPDTIALIPYDQPLVVYGGTVATVLYKCISNLGEDHLILGVPDRTDYLIAREGDTESQNTGGVFGPLDWLNNGADAGLPMFGASLSGVGSVTFGIYSLEGLDFTTAKVTLKLRVYNGQRAPTSSAQAFSSTFPGLSAGGLVDVSTEGDLVFANVLSPSGSTGLFWGVNASNTVFLTAGAGLDIPGGADTFGSSTDYRSTTADGVVFFRAPVDGAGSGIFRRGE